MSLLSEIRWLVRKVQEIKQMVKETTFEPDDG